MSTGNGGKEFAQVKQCMRILESCKTHCYQVRNTEQKDVAMGDDKVDPKFFLLEAFTALIQEVKTWSKEKVHSRLENNKIVFRRVFEAPHIAKITFELQEIKD